VCALVCSGVRVGARSGPDGGAGGYGGETVSGPSLRRILSDPDVRVIVVGHNDRLVRFGVEHPEASLGARGGGIVVTDPGETTDHLVRDLVDVLTTMCAIPYGRRAAWNRAMRALTAAKREPGQAP
jgi:putative resolvase